jgi:hypothetical protein
MGEVGQSGGDKAGEMADQVANTAMNDAKNGDKLNERGAYLALGRDEYEQQVRAFLVSLFGS